VQRYCFFLIYANIYHIFLIFFAKSEHFKFLCLVHRKQTFVYIPKKQYLCTLKRLNTPIYMIITSLIDDLSANGLPTEHGLCLHIQLRDGLQVLFDMGQSELFWQNAQRMGLDLKEINVAIVSHGHYDHGGGLVSFLEGNDQATVYVHKDAFLPHYSLREDGLTYIGLDPKLSNHPRLVMCDSPLSIQDHLRLFSDVQGSCCYPPGNRLLFGSTSHVNDTFCHEQNLIIEEGGLSVLIAGCAHRGIVNILRRSTEMIGHAPTYVLAGMHLLKSGLNPADEATFIRQLAAELMHYSHTQFYTMHCTGKAYYDKLRSIMGTQITYLSGGDQIVL